MVFVRFVLFCTDTVNDFLGKNCPYIAGAISFYTLFSIFPLFLAIISVLGYVVGSRAEEEQVKLAQSIADVMPVSSDYVSENVQSVIHTRAITGVASIFGLLWAATLVFGAIRKGINSAWGIKKPRPFLKERLIDFTLVLGAGTVLLAVWFAPVGLGVLQEITNVFAPESEIFNKFLWRVIDTLILPLLAFLTFLVLYTYLPNTNVRVRDAWLGALLASLAFDAANLGFVWFVKSYAPYNLLYGSVSAILAFLTWVYLSAIIVLLGAVVTSRYAAYAASIEIERPSLKFLWTGFSRVRLRVVASTEAV